MTLVKLKEHWHRAYLMRMIAQTRPEPERQAIVAYAERAREDYVALATPPPTVLTPVFQRWIRSDGAPEEPRRFSPRYPSGGRPPR